jgi:hypothetical protein
MANETPFTSSTRLNGRFLGADETESDKDNKMTYAIRLRQQHRDRRFTEEFTLYARGEEGQRILGGVRERDLVVIDAHITKGNSNNTVITADAIGLEEEIETFERTFELTGELEDCITKPLGSLPEDDGDEMAELTIIGERDGAEVSVCVKAFKERVAISAGVPIGSKVHVAGRVKTHEVGDRQLTSLHLVTIEVVD